MKGWGKVSGRKLWRNSLGGAEGSFAPLSPKLSNVRSKRGDLGYNIRKLIPNRHVFVSVGSSQISQGLSFAHGALNESTLAPMTKHMHLQLSGIHAYRNLSNSSIRASRTDLEPYYATIIIDGTHAAKNGYLGY